MMKHNNNNQCCPLVKDAFSIYHKKCPHQKKHAGNNRHSGYSVLGSFLNKYSSVVHFDHSSSYNICSNLKRLFDINSIKEVTQIQRIENPVAITPITFPEPGNREDRALIRDAKATVETIKRKNIELAKQNEILLGDRAGLKCDLSSLSDLRQENIELVQQNQSLKVQASLNEPLRKQRKYSEGFFHDRISDEAKRFRKPYRDINFKSRLMRTDMICSLIIASCIDPDEVESDYYIGNEEFGTTNRRSLNFLVNNIRRLLQVFLYEVKAY